MASENPALEAHDDESEPDSEAPPTSSRRVAKRGDTPAADDGGRGARLSFLLASIFVVSACAITYELLVGAVASYLLGNSVRQFSLTIGVFLASMGIGAWVSQWFREGLLDGFVGVEIALSTAGGVSGWLLLWAFTYTQQYYLVMFGLIIVVGTLIGLELPLLTRYLRQFASLRQALARVMSLDYLGALAASVAFPLVLLPWLGVFRTSLAVGLFNVAVAMATTALFWTELQRPLRLIAASVVVTLGLIAGLVRAAPVLSTMERDLYQDTVIYAAQSSYQRIVMTRHNEDLRLYLEGSLQFSSMDEYRYHEALVHPALSATPWKEEVLVIGGGDGLAVREVLRHPGVKRVVLVDLDPAVTELAASHPALVALNGDSLHDSRVTVINDDGYSYLRHHAGRFGAIFVDLPDPSREALAKLYSVSFYRMVGDHLARGGIAVTQATSPMFARRSFWGIAATVEAAGLHATPYHTYVPSFGDWGFVMMSPEPHDLATVRLAVPASSLSAELLPTMTRFAPDIGPIPVEASTIERPTILGYYDESMSRWR
ncbi:MAG: polyamine aminopropyltransferase [Polyangiaceae bacterium]